MSASHSSCFFELFSTANHFPKKSLLLILCLLLHSESFSLKTLVVVHLIVLLHGESRARRSESSLVLAGLNRLVSGALLFFMANLFLAGRN